MEFMVSSDVEVDEAIENFVSQTKFQARIDQTYRF